ncbi:hypothetical protein I545_0093 [Mycobacterium kansasii 662]|uniref:Uncharacterized protein n=2 Tax=Mycobacterium kansasii TaxID=1768 RepID=U5X1Y6_MYCKA|nr:hypothetical protein MKAN_20090 [Mycobacterium kansasii ATCC 12478]EUA04566.1 hypothetical protein I547_1355 [Mycobacterium kansasii 824]EUA21993.1 hypothetical protein I545_0093 [Mycobacterium kansasii 662]KEP43681.1 hypothetical protein MKSMC1_10450 [Mycobacterium kansasii]
MAVGKLLGWRAVRRGLGSMSVAENLPPWTHQVHLTGTRVAPGSAREKVW